MLNFLPKKSILIVLIIFSFQAGIVFAQKDQILSGSEISAALDKLNVLGSVLYIAAHPDDENTSLLAYLSRGRQYRTAYLSLTRGDGGQNLLGTEKGAEIGILRTQELLEARKIDGAEQYFSNAIDFGYSKTAEESLEFWDGESVLADIVWVIRKFRPDIIVTRFPPGGGGGHGHHSASADLAVEAFDASGNPERFPEQLKYVKPWKAERVFWNNWRSSGQNEITIKVNIGEYDPMLGRSYTELAADSRSKHKSQGFGSSGRRGERFDSLQLIAGKSALNDLFEGINITWGRVNGGTEIQAKLKSIRDNFNPVSPSEIIPDLISLYNDLDDIKRDPWVEVKQKELLKIIRSCAGLWMEASSEVYAASAGDKINIVSTIVNRSESNIVLRKVAFPDADLSYEVGRSLKNNEPVSIEKTIVIPSSISTSQPYWLRSEPNAGRFNVNDQVITGMAENPSSLSAIFTLIIGETEFDFNIPVLFRWTDRVAGELYRPFEIRPKVTLDLEEKVSMFAEGEGKDIVVKLKGHSQDIKGIVRFRGTDGWEIKPDVKAFSLQNRFDEKQLVFKVIPPDKPGETEITVEAEVDGKRYDKSLVEISYPHISRQVYFPKSKMKLVNLDINIPGGRIGYIMGAGDEIPQSLRSIGYEVILLSDEELESGDLSIYNAIISGIRAYNTRSRLKYAQTRLMDYVKEGGTFLVQYNVTSGLPEIEIGPYPFRIGRDRVSVETAPVKFTDPDHRIFNYPNKITYSDFDDWVQERGLYFASHWDSQFETVLSSNDPDETDKHGSIILAKYGKGIFIYSGLSWFRQLPAGVPGAYRLFINLISSGDINEQ